MKILIFGSTGMLGSSVLLELYQHSKFDIFATFKDSEKKNLLLKKIKQDNKKNIKFINVDILKISDLKLKNLISKMDIIINCIGLIKQKIHNPKDEKNAIKLNSLFPEKLNFLKKKKQKIYQIATDCVFSGKKGGYNENDFHDFEDAYGLSKSQGEIIDKNFFNIRCSLIGYEFKSNNSLFNWFMNTTHKSTVKGYSNHIWNGVSTAVFAKIINQIIKSKISLPNKFHLVPSDKISKYNILKFLNKIHKKSIKLIEYKPKQKIDRTLSTNYKDLNLEIWNKTFKKQLTIREIIKDYIY